MNMSTDIELEDGRNYDGCTQAIVCVAPLTQEGLALLDLMTHADTTHKGQQKKHSSRSNNNF